LRSTYSGRRVWTGVLFSQNDVKHEFPSPSMQRRGRKPAKLEQAKEAMRDDITQGRRTQDQLQSMKGKELAHRYEVGRTTAIAARRAILER
jgi:hypothetical protein